MVLQWLVDVPAELRFKVYTHIFASMEVTNRQRLYNHGEYSFRPRDPNRGPWNLLLTAKGVKEEAEPFFWALSNFDYDVTACYISPKIGYCCYMPGPNRFYGIKHMAIGSDDWDSFSIDLMLYWTGASTHNKMQHLTFRNLLIFADDSNIRYIMRNIIIACKDRVSLLELRVDPYCEDGVPAGEYWVDWHTLLIRDTYNVSINSADEKEIRTVRDILREFHGGDASKVMVTPTQEALDDEEADREEEEEYRLSLATSGS